FIRAYHSSNSMILVSNRECVGCAESQRINDEDTRSLVDSPDFVGRTHGHRSRIFGAQTCPLIYRVSQVGINIALSAQISRGIACTNAESKRLNSLAREELKQFFTRGNNTTRIAAEIDYDASGRQACEYASYMLRKIVVVFDQEIKNPK